MSSRTSRCLSLAAGFISLGAVAAQGEPAANPAARPVVTVKQYEALVGGPTLVSFKAQMATEGEILKAMAGQAGLPDDAQCSTVGTPFIDLAVHEQPFWRAMLAVARKSGRWYRQIGVRTVAPCSAPVPEVAFQGLFGTHLGAADDLVLTRSTGDGEVVRIPVLSFTLLCDPRADVTGGSVHVIRATVTDTEGRKYALSPPTFGPPSGNGALMIPMSLELPEGLPREKVAMLEGALRVTASIARGRWADRITVPGVPLTHVVQTSNGPIEVNIKAIKGLENPKSFEVVATCRGPNQAVESQIRATFFDALTLSGPGVSGCERIGGGERGGEAWKMLHPYGQAESDAVRLPIDFTWGFSMRDVDVEIPFSFRNVKLPPAGPTE